MKVWSAMHDVEDEKARVKSSSQQAAPTI